MNNINATKSQNNSIKDAKSIGLLIVEYYLVKAKARQG
jgi:hypothetical protein